MGTRGGSAERSGAGGPACAQDALQAPRMAQEALQARHECLCPSPRPEAVLGHIWKPPALSLPERHPFDETRIDDKARWTAACARYLGLVERLCRKYRREFPAAKYGASALGGLRERLALLQQFGGVPKSVLSLNSVPAEQLEEAVEAFAECFGLAGDAATGHLEGTPSATHLDPAPLNAGTLEVPW